MTVSSAEQVDLDVLAAIQQRVLWLATRIVDAANHDRDTGDGVKVGGHQASSASLVSVMTALYFAYLDGPKCASTYRRAVAANSGAAAPSPTDPVEKSGPSGSLVRLG